MNEQTLITRLALCYLADLAGIPQTRPEIERYIRRRANASARGTLPDALARLSTLGYIADATPTADEEPMYRITATGLRQALRQVPAAELDPMIWNDAT